LFKPEEREAESVSLAPDQQGLTGGQATGIADVVSHGDKDERRPTMTIASFLFLLFSSCSSRRLGHDRSLTMKHNDNMHKQQDTHLNRPRHRHRRRRHFLSKQYVTFRFGKSVSVHGSLGILALVFTHSLLLNPANNVQYPAISQLLNSTIAFIAATLLPQVPPFTINCAAPSRPLLLVFDEQFHVLSCSQSDARSHGNLLGTALV
jgi:hypothetical protein